MITGKQKTNQQQQQHKKQHGSRVARESKPAILPINGQLIESAKIKEWLSKLLFYSTRIGMCSFSILIADIDTLSVL